MFCCDVQETTEAKGALKIALVGNTNSGKTTLFNTLTGLLKHVSNYPGTTVSVSEGAIDFHGKKFLFADLPGIYSFHHYSSEELVAQKILHSKKFDCIFCVIDPVHLIRSLTLVLELMELETPIFLVINIQKHHKVNSQLIENIKQFLGMPAVVIDALEKNSKEVLLNAFLNATKGENNYQKILDGIYNGEKKKELQQKRRYDFIKNNFSSLFIAKNNFSSRLDEWLLKKYIGIPFFLMMMWAIFELTFTLSAPLSDMIDSAIQYLIQLVISFSPNSLLASLFGNGILAGVGATLVFLPQIFILFFLLGVLEQSGYLARVAFILEHIMVRLGIHGKSAVALLMGFGCNVPAIMALRTLPTQKEKIITAMMLPFMSCSARLPVFILFIGAFVLEKWQGTVLAFLYFFGVSVSIFTAFLVKKAVPGKSKSLLIELPEYRMPRIKNLIPIAQHSAKHFLVRAGRIILPFTVFIWILFSFPQGLDHQNSYATQIGKTIQPIFAPLGFDWRISTGLIAGLGAKEIMVATLGTLYSVENTEDIKGLTERLRQDPIYTPQVIAALLVFILLYTPCISVIATLKSELGAKWALFGLIYPTIFAWFAAFFTYHIMNFLL